MSTSPKTVAVVTKAKELEKDAKKWFGTKIPDLTVVARARGADWLYTYMRTFYLDPNHFLASSSGMATVMVSPTLSAANMRLSITCSSLRPRS